MVTLVLGLSLLVAFLSTVMTIGNALNRTDMAKFWALLSTAAMFVTMFIFIVDTYDLLGVKKEDQPVSVAEQLFKGLGEQDQASVTSDLAGYDAQQLNYLQATGQGIVYDSEVARIMLLDLLAKRFTGDLSGLTASQKQWFLEQKHLYPADTESQVAEIAGDDVGYQQLIADLEEYKQTIVKGNGVVLEVVAPAPDAVVEDMQIQLLTEDKNVYILYYPASLELKVGDAVQFYGTPIAQHTLDSATFGKLNAILFYTNYIIK